MKKASKVLGIISLVHDILGLLICLGIFLLLLVLSLAPVGLAIYLWQNGNFEAMYTYLNTAEGVREWNPDLTVTCLFLFIMLVVNCAVSGLGSLGVYELIKHIFVVGGDVLFLGSLSKAETPRDRRFAALFEYAVGIYHLYKGTLLGGAVSIIAAILAGVRTKEEKEIDRKAKEAANAVKAELRKPEAPKAEEKATPKAEVKPAPKAEAKPAPKAAPAKEEAKKAPAKK